mmetsp:Transcript_13110/g.19288  ORF Transcript_13110/g.19288 Transcript_13110/m.19288 type:complete len:311 (+) Transcript_13110:157-1089(+)
MWHRFAIVVALCCFHSRILALQVTVVGGTGFVGSRVCKLLADQDEVSVTSLSKTGRIPEWCKQDSWTQDVTWKAVDLLSSKDLDMGNPDVIVSCVGVVGTDPEELKRGNGVANEVAFTNAGSKLQRSVLISVSEEVAACQDNWLPEFFKGYFDGKKMAERAALDAVAGDATKSVVIKPTFIYGGDSFGLLPPRVNYEYGSGVEELLSTSVFKALADVTPGLIKVALRPPVSVDSVAAAAAAAAIGDISGGVLDGAASINAATDQPAAKGLTEALTWAKEKILVAYDWAQKEGLPKAKELVKGTMDKIESK